MQGDFSLALPMLVLVAGAFLLYLAGRLFKCSNRTESLLTALILAAALAALIHATLQVDGALPIFGTLGKGGVSYRMDLTGVIIGATALFVGILISLYSGEYLSRDPRYFLYYPLILLLLSGMLGLLFAQELFNLFLLAELTTIAASALIAFRFHQEASIKAGFKYLMMSSLGTMVMLLGLYFVYRGMGELNLAAIAAQTNDLTRIGGACFVLGFSLKAGVVPLHTWVPEVYTHAPTTLSGLLAGVLSKGMLFMLPPVCLNLGLTPRELGLYLILFSVLNMLLGAIRALNQRHLRRFLSFSAIAQTGYLMFALGVAVLHQSADAYAAAVFLFVVIALTKCLAFLAAGMYEYALDTGDIHQLAGVYRRMPLTAYCFSLALAGLAGLPLLGGFIGKWLVVSAALSAAGVVTWVGLVVFLLSTLIGLGGYLPLLAQQFIGAPKTDERLPHASWRLRLPVLILSALIILLGLLPAPWLAVLEAMMTWINFL
jgi:F420H2 dehydrogenase subunit N